MGARLLIWVLEAHHVADLRLETDFLLGGLGAALLFGAFPGSAIWRSSRTSASCGRTCWFVVPAAEGRFRDPLVGRHLLVGCLAIAIGMHQRHLCRPRVGAPPSAAGFRRPTDFRHRLQRLSPTSCSRFPPGLGFCALLALLHRRCSPTAIQGRDQVRRPVWKPLAAHLTVGLSSPACGSDAAHRTANFTLPLLGEADPSVSRTFAFGHFLPQFAISLDPSVWYFEESVLALGLFLAVAFWGFYHSLGGRPLFGGGTRERAAAR